MLLSQGMLLCVRPPHDTSTFPPRMSPRAPNLEAAPCASADPIAPPFFGRGVAGHVPGCQAGRGAPVSSVPVVFQRGGVGASWLPPGWNSVAYFKPLAQGVSSSSADFFRTLFVQALRGGRKRGGGEQLLLAPQPAAHLRQRWSALPAATLTMLGVTSQLLAVCPPGCRGGAPNPALDEHPSKWPASERRQGPVWVPSVPRAGGSAAQRGLVPGSRTDGKSRRGARSSARMKPQLDAAEDTGKAQKHPKGALERPPATRALLTRRGCDAPGHPADLETPR